MREPICTLRVPTVALLHATVDKCGRKKLPFAGYSIVKEPNSSAGAGVSGVPRRRKAGGLAQTKQSGEYRARTGDLLVANQALSQLS